ncbi:uncharacterized protein F4822DRAFT_440557 [Hypoxylon trugodes]|uniref:uncharacterized protein n=1 Tax=Hypoxylon trugodes TaxID=326681 RepID=UPI0021949420|nr:uncharacterized protein F4822DRAFT_440557 [Hypoxylon trugodes]KAI1383516.1 hypothetical protein F4822DRAFT_440557 [Hypoxylon trugodes]
MRYDDWDVLLFPKDCKIPLKEFKTDCHVIHDNEFAFTHGSYGLPTMTCFIPGLAQGTQFNISLHSWKTPEVSQFTKNFSKHLDLVKFEARVIIDGRLVASSSFSRTGPWPQLINHSFEFTKNGDLETLRFPHFRREMLQQSYWSPADEVGRIKIVISEGFPRDSLTAPIERVKNIVAFSFQHAPIDVLEGSGIAWPNPRMWRRTPFNPTMPVPSRHHEDGADAHLHSPRRRSTSYMKGISGSSMYNTCPPGLTNANPNHLLGSMPNTQALLQRGGAGPSSTWADPFNTQKSEGTAFAWTSGDFGPVGCGVVNSGKSSYNPAANRSVTGTSKISQSDTSMPDYGLGDLHNAQSISDHQFLNMPTSHIENADMATHDPKAPTNTPTTMVGSNFIDDLNIDMGRIDTPASASVNDFFNPSHANFSSELATSLTHSLLNQPHPLPVHAGNFGLPASEVKSRKENRLHRDSPIEDVSGITHIDMRKVSQSSLGNLGKETRDTSTNNSPPSQSTLSGMFSRRSTSGADSGNDLPSVSNVFTHSGVDAVCDAKSDSRIISGADKANKRIRHFTPISGNIIDDDIEALTNSPRIQIEPNDQFGVSV